MLLAGCIMDGWFGPVHDATVELLQRAGYRVEVPEAQTCCGALAAHDGHADTARRLAAQNVAAFASADVVVADAAGCSAHLKEYAHLAPGGADFSAKVRDVTELVAELIADGSLPTLEPTHQAHLLVCTNGTRDVCCATKGRPVAQGACKALPDRVWEVTHTSGHRFAPTAARPVFASHSMRYALVKLDDEGIALDCGAPQRGVEIRQL